ncbi:flagellar motor protein MotS [Virgibacillus sediminis]|uniref:Flagellar motor protein MotS n=1 Tax=Virgibacillus sediminis TaxID=202260 RepID=A0ABV7A760_9BACI
MRRKFRREKNGAPKWMVTYSDMVTLILVFFILLFSMSQIDQMKFEAVFSSFQNRMIFDSFPSPVPMEHPSESSRITEGELPGGFDRRDGLSDKNESVEEDLDGLLENVERYLTENELHEVITANRTDQGVALVLQERLLFPSGEAQILDTGKPFLDRVGTLLKNLPNDVMVEGHTDNRPMAGYRFPSNWELSGARASSVVRYLIDNHQLEQSRFSISGYGETRPVVPNTSAENMKKNRRVEMIIMKNISVTEENGTGR